MILLPLTMQTHSAFVVKVCTEESISGVALIIILSPLALASAADLSCIEISSRTSRSKESWSIILKGGEQLYYGPSTRWRRESSGTSVLLRDVFFNVTTITSIYHRILCLYYWEQLPVRRLSHPNPSRTIELIKRELEQLALMHPDISFSLKDESKELSTVPERSRVLVIPKVWTQLYYLQVVIYTDL